MSGQHLQGNACGQERAPYVRIGDNVLVSCHFEAGGFNGQLPEPGLVCYACKMLRK